MTATEMTTVNLVLELETDVSIRESNRTLGSGGTLTWLPGRVLWGAAAAAAYRDGMDDDEAFALFHRGLVRFRDAVPLAGSERTYPVPRSWHAPKGTTGSTALVNLAATDPSDGIQWKPLEEGWLSPDAVRIVVPTALSMRTALERTGRAKEGLLHTLSAIRAGTRFCTSLSGPREAVESLVNRMTSQGLALGKSKNTELGRVRVTRSAQSFGRLASALSSGATDISFLCVSRLVLHDPETGFPTIVPDPRAFGLDATWQLVPERTFIRPVKVVHFNAKRARPETERLALERGSVVTFSGPSNTLDLEGLQKLEEVGIGAWRHQGYGEILVHPQWLANAAAHLAESSPEVRAAAVPEPEDALFQWARQRARETAMSLEIGVRAGKLARELAVMGIPPAQWGALHQKARWARIHGTGANAFREEMTRYFATGRRNVAEAWKGGTRQRLLAALEAEGEKAAVFLEHLANAGMRARESSAEEALG